MQDKKNLNYPTIWKETTSSIKLQLRKYKILRVRGEQNDVEYSYG